MVVMVVDLKSQLRFFVGTIVSFAIGRAISIEREITIGFFGLFLW